VQCAVHSSNNQTNNWQWRTVHCALHCLNTWQWLFQQNSRLAVAVWH
jgi:hypothetical protein